MSKILKNLTASPVVIADVGQTIPASSQLTINPQDYLLYAASDDVIILVGNSTLVVNDGSSDLSISDGAKLIQGIFPNPVGIKGGSDGSQVGNVGDRLKVDAAITVPENAPFTLPEYEDILYRLRTTQPRQLFQGQWGFNGQPLIWSQLLSSGALLDDPSVTEHNFIQLRTDGTAGESAVLQTQRYFRYQHSRNHSLTFAAAFGSPTAGVVKRAGQFDNDVGGDGSNGFYIENDDSNGITFVIAATSSGSQTFNKIARSNWNTDKLDGNGPSGLNYTNAQLGNAAVWNIDYSWYGASVVQFNIVIGSTRIVLHEETYSLVNADFPFTKTAFLPLRFELLGNSSTSPTQFTIGSISYDIENGEVNEFGYQWSVSNATNGQSVGNSSIHLLSVRPRLLVNGIKNRGVLVPNNVRLLSTDDLYLEVLVGGNATGGTWTDVDTTRSIAEYSENVTGYTGGRVVYTDYIAAGGGRSTGALATSFPGDLFAAIDSLLGTQQAFTIRARRIFGNSKAYAAISWKEIY